MSLQIVGAGLGRTGTHSLKLALQTLLGEPCYHMDVVGAEDHIDLWRRAAEGDEPDWHDVFAGYAAAVDWPMAAFWESIGAAFPDAKVLLSTRESGAAWYRSANRTIFERHPDSATDTPFEQMWQAVSKLTFDGSYTDEAIAIDGYERHNAHVRAAVPADRLIEYRPGDGWEPLCRGLGVDIPDEPFPHTNTTDQFRRAAGLDE